MKKLLIVMITLFLATGAVFAGGQKDTTKAMDSRISVRLITDATGIDDKSFNAAAWKGILEYYGDSWEDQKGRGDVYDVVTCATQDMYIPTLKQAADEGYDLIVATGFTFADALGEVAALYPEQKFAIVDVSWVNQPNVMEFVMREEQGSFLVGVTAALQAQADNISNPKFGFIGGVPGYTITKFEMGYLQGIKAVYPNLPDSSFVDYYANSWGSPELAKTQSKNWFDSGVYAIFSAAGGTGGGTIAMAKEYRSQGKNVWAIGVDSDQYEDGIYEGKKSAVLTSMVKRVESATLYALNAVEDDSFVSGVITLDMAANGVDYSKANPELSAEVQKSVDMYKQKIVDGSITVVDKYAACLEAGIAPAGLGAIDD
ncbi:MAG: BMP family ABC transporter substrate-binding protein [Treponema sp. CETP13]|nr:MAG: BMP family ABC transporter substrate-binding protein [Treponema sp. CETP13]